MNLPSELLEAIVLQAPDALICADVDGNILLWNQGAERIFGHAATEVLGHSLDIIIPERLRSAHETGFRNAVASGRTKHAAGRVLTTRSLHQNGNKLYVDLSFGLLKNRAGVVIGILAIGRDCTGRHVAGQTTARS